MAAKRTSSVDGLNFNRTFPGDPYGTITEQISAYVNDHIFPLGDAFLDLHSGGSSLDILPSAIIEPTLDPELSRRNVAAARAFDAPHTVVIGNLGDPRTATASACRAGLTTVGTEMAGGGRVSIDALALCRRGVRNVLAHLGVIDERHRTIENPDGPTFEMRGAAAYVFADVDGIFEPAHRLGVRVSAGEPAGRIHAVWNPRQPPQTVRYGCDGIVFAHRQPGRVRPGNCCAVVAAPL
jgi:predicted deacylase